jgi:N-acetylneuraminic acid mutarotase
MIGKDLIIISGFKNGFYDVTAENYALDVSDPNAKWRRMDDLPVPDGITHAGFAVVGQKLYMCGGYLGGNPGPDIPDCFIYDHSVQPGTSGQWSTFEPLPEGRGGGGMIYDTKSNALIFAAGADREQGTQDTIDPPTTWMYDFDNKSAGWLQKQDIPYVGNHISFVTAYDGNGKERHYFAGGQIGGDEWTGNLDNNVEWDAENEKWIERKPMPSTKGHAASSTRAIGCGYIMVGGSSNSRRGETDDISYYDIPSDTWIKIGTLPKKMNTPVCDIYDGWLYCESGPAWSKFSYKRELIVE